VIVDEFQQPGNYNLNFDASRLSSGVYFYKLLSRRVESSTEGYSDVKKMILLK